MNQDNINHDTSNQNINKITLITQEQLDDYNDQLLLEYNIIPTLVENLSCTTINNCIPFIKRYLKTKNKNINKSHSCYSLNLLFEKLIGSPINSGNITVALLHCGFDIKVIGCTVYFNVATKNIREIQKILI